MGKRLLAIVASAFLVGGCAMPLPPHGDVAGTFVHASSLLISSRDYTIDPPDEIIVHCQAIKELDGQKRKVASDGTISLPLVGDVQVAKLTTHKCTQLLREKVSIFYRDPELTIEVVDNSKFYLVFGPGANNPGRKVFTGSDTVVQAVAEAGLNDNAWPEQVLVSRPRKDGDGPGTRAVVDFKQIMEAGDLSQNYVLEQGDIIDLRDSPLTVWNKKVDQILPFFGQSQAVVRTGKP